MTTEGRPPLIQVDLKNYQGLFTKSSSEILSPEQLAVAQNVDFVALYGAASKLRGNLRILTNAAPTPVSWVGFYKSVDLNGQILRQVLIAAGTTLQLINSDGSLTQLTSGRTSGLVHTYAINNRLMLLTNQNDQLKGQGDQLVKYDGHSLTNWGVLAPGGTETLEDNFNTPANYSVSNCVISESAVTTWDGFGLNITTNPSPPSTPAYIQRTYAGTFTPNTTRTNGLAVYLYIPRGQYTKLSTDGLTGNPAVQLFFGSDSNLTTNYYRFDFTIGTLVEGWNKLTCDFSTAPTATLSVGGSVGGTSGTFTGAVKTFSAQFNSQGVQASFNCVLSHLVIYDQGTPNTAGGSSGNPNGVYTYMVTYVSRYGNESNGGPISPSVTVTNSQINLTNLPTSTDGQVVQRKIYRTVAGGTQYLLLTTIFDNTTLTFTDNLGDGSLGVQQAPQAGAFTGDNSPPPQAGLVRVWKQTVFMAGDPLNPDILYFSSDTEPEQFPINNQFQLDGRITAIYETYSGLVIETENGKWQCLGDNPSFAVDKIIDGIGCVGRRASGTAKLLGYSADRDGIRLFDLSDVRKISESIRDKFDALPQSTFGNLFMIHSKANNAILLFAQDGNGNFTNIFMYQYAIDEIRNGWWSVIVPPATIQFLDAREVEDTNGQPHLYVGAADGQVYELMAANQKNWVDNSGEVFAMDSIIQTNWVRVGGQANAPAQGGLTGRVHPRLVESRSKGDTPTTWNITVDTGSGPYATPTTSLLIPSLFNAGETLKRYPTQGMQADEYVRWTAENDDINVACALVALRTYLYVHPGQYPKET